MTLLEAIDAGPKALKAWRGKQWPPRMISLDLQKLQKAGLIYWVPATQGPERAYIVHGHWARVAPVDKL